MNVLITDLPKIMKESQRSIKRTGALEKGATQESVKIKKKLPHMIIIISYQYDA